MSVAFAVQYDRRGGGMGKGRMEGGSDGGREGILLLSRAIPTPVEPWHRA